MFKKEKLKYPIQYAIMSIKEYDRFNNNEYQTISHIVSKCYVVGKIKHYNEDGTFRYFYKIVFPFDCTLQKRIPEFSYEGKCINSELVTELYSNLEDAKRAANMKNKDIINSTIGILPLDENFQENRAAEIKKHNQILERYKEIEKEIEKMTLEMEITNDHCFDLENILEKVIENPRDFYAKIAYSLSVEEREFLKNLIKNKSCSNCTNSSCNVECSEKNGLDTFGNQEGNNCLGWNNPELIGRQLILTKNL